VDAYEQLEALMELARDVGLSVRPMPGGVGEGDHAGGALARIKGQEVLFLDAQAAIADQTAVLAAALADREELENRYLPPEVRQCLQEHAQRKNSR
jgi:hypothetical protein